MGAQGHGLKGGCISASTHLRWLATGAPDGKLILRATGAIVSMTLFDFKPFSKAP